MNKKGFTLTELLVTIGILAIMSLVVGVNMTSILRSTDKKEEKFNVEQIEKAACVFASSSVRTLEHPDLDDDSKHYTKDYTNCDTSECTIKVADLELAGLISKDMSKDRKDKTVTVSYTDNQKKCTYNP